MSYGCTRHCWFISLLFLFASELILFVLLKLYVHEVQFVNSCVQFDLYLCTAYVSNVRSICSINQSVIEQMNVQTKKFCEYILHNRFCCIVLRLTPEIEISNSLVP